MSHPSLGAAVVLACRAESTRLYGKPMQLVGDRPILQHLLDRLHRLASVDAIVLAVSDSPSREVFTAFARERGLRAIVGPELDVVGRLIAGAEMVGARVLVRVTTENPFIYWENVDELVRRHVDTHADLTITEQLPIGAFLEVVSMEALRAIHREGEDRHRQQMPAAFLIEREGRFRINRVTVPDDVRGADIRLTVDTPGDLIRVRRLWEALQRPGHLITIAEIVALVRAHPEVVVVPETLESISR